MWVRNSLSPCEGVVEVVEVVEVEVVAMAAAALTSTYTPAESISPQP